MNFIDEKDMIEKIGGRPFEEILPHIGHEAVNVRMRGENVRNEYYVKERWVIFY